MSRPLKTFGTNTSLSKNFYIIVNLNWRKKTCTFLFSLSACPQGSVYIHCYLDCLPTCYEKRPPICNMNCRYGGCACIPPMILDEDKMKCVMPEECEFGP